MWLTALLTIGTIIGIFIYGTYGLGALFIKVGKAEENKAYLSSFIIVLVVVLFFSAPYIAELIPDKSDEEKEESLLESCNEGNMGGYEDERPAHCGKPSDDTYYGPSPSPKSPGYHGVDRNGDGTDDYIRSNPDGNPYNNINQ